MDILTYQGARILTNNQDNPYAKIESGINHLKLKQIEDLKHIWISRYPSSSRPDDGDYLALVEARVKAALGKEFQRLPLRTLLSGNFTAGH